jgi:acyl-CoA dehydrogenase
VPDPMNLHLDEQQVALLDDCTALSQETLKPIASAGPQGRVNPELLAAIAAAGLFDRLYTRVDGDWSARISALDLCLIREGLARGCTEAETAFAVQGLGSFPILLSGRPDVTGPWIEKLASGQAAAGFALTEPQAGTDVAAMSLEARRDGDGFRLTGEKVWISNAPDASVYSVFARTTEGAGARGLTAFMVPSDTAGLGGERLTLVSPHPIGRLIFEDAFVPAEYVLGEVDRGFAVAMRTLDLFRPSVGAFAIGMARAALDATVLYVSQREAFGRPLKELQAVSHRIADIETRVCAARLLVYQAARAYDLGLRPVTHMAAMAKLMATELAQEAVDAGVQFHGGRALEHGHLLEHLYREVRAPRIYEGASEIQREIIARHLFKTAAEKVVAQA